MHGLTPVSGDGTQMRFWGGRGVDPLGQKIPSLGVYRGGRRMLADAVLSGRALRKLAADALEARSIKTAQVYKADR
jgi:hypothetical protein